MVPGKIESTFEKNGKELYDRVKDKVTIGDVNGRERIFDGIQYITTNTRGREIDKTKVVKAVENMMRYGLFEEKYLPKVLKFTAAVGMPALDLLVTKTENLKKMIDYKYYFEINESPESIRGLGELVKKGFFGPIAVTVTTARKLKADQLASIARSVYNSSFKEKIDLVVLDNGPNSKENAKILADEKFWSQNDRDGLIRRIHLTSRDILKLEKMVGRNYKLYSNIYPQGVSLPKIVKDFNKMFGRIPFRFFPDYLSMAIGHVNTSYGGSRNVLSTFASLGDYNRHIRIDDDVYVENTLLNPKRMRYASIADPENYLRGDNKGRKTIGLANVIGHSLSCEFPLGDLKEIYKTYVERRRRGTQDLKGEINEMEEIMSGRPRKMVVNRSIGWGDAPAIENHSGILFSTHTNFDLFFPSLDFRGEDYLPPWAYKDLETLSGKHDRDWRSNPKEIAKRHFLNELPEYMPERVLGAGTTGKNVKKVKDSIISNLLVHKQEIDFLIRDMEENAPELEESVIKKLKAYSKALTESKIPKIGLVQKEYNQAREDMDRFAVNWKEWLRVTKAIHKREGKGLGTFYGKVYVNRRKIM